MSYPSSCMKEEMETDPLMHIVKKIEANVKNNNSIERTIYLTFCVEKHSN